MHNAIWYVVGAVAVVVVGVGAYMTMDKAPSSTETNATSTSQSEMSLRELAGSQAPQKCTFTSLQNTQGTVYVAGGRVRADFSTSLNGTAITGHSIVVDNMSYVWMDGQSQGYKNSFEAIAEPGSATDSGLNPDERVTYSCEPWTPDENLLTPPTNITFTSISDVQVKAGAGAVGASCSQCNQIPDAAAKAQCLAALKCQ